MITRPARAGGTGWPRCRPGPGRGQIASQPSGGRTAVFVGDLVDRGPYECVFAVLAVESEPVDPRL